MVPFLVKLADTASLRAPLCTEQFGSGAPRSCSAAADGSLQWDGAQRWGWFSRASITKPGQHEGGDGGPWAALTALSGLRSVLLPQGFPDSVSPDYLPYQLWDSVQVRPAYCHGGWRAYDWGPREQAPAICICTLKGRVHCRVLTVFRVPQSQ